MADKKETKFNPDEWASYKINKDGTKTGLIPKTKTAGEK